MSRQETHTEKSNESEMFLSFCQQSREVLDQLERFRKVDHLIRCGLEVEYGLVNSQFRPATEFQRDQIVRQNSAFTDVELGAAQIEIRTDPIVLDNTSPALLNQLFSRDQLIARSARDLGLHLVSHGTNPFVDPNNIERTTLSKYKLVPDYHNQRRRKDISTHIGVIDRVDVGDAGIIGVANSVQLNIEAFNEQDAVDKLNRSFQLGPLVVGMFANARFLGCHDTGIADTRMISWQISHDTRTPQQVAQGQATRIGLPTRHYLSLQDYFRDITQYPFILDAPQAAIFVGIGLLWRDARIKIIQDSLVVEFRPVSTQPIPEQNYASMIFYLGRLLWSQANNEPLMPISKIEQNRTESMSKGEKARLWTYVDDRFKRISLSRVRALEVDRAIEALRNADVLDCDTQDILLKLRSQTESGSTQLSNLRQLRIKRRQDPTQALAESMEQLKGIH